MAALPAATITVTTEGASLDLICFEYAYALLGNRRRAGKLVGYLEAVLDANPGLSDIGTVLPIGTAIMLPEFSVAADAPKTVRLWD